MNNFNSKVEKIDKYGKVWSAGTNLLEIELSCFWNGRTIEQGGLGKAKHFENCVKTLWPHNQIGRKSVRPCVWHPWLYEMVDEICKNNFIAISGCASSSKTDLAALWAIVNFLAIPWLTTVLVTSTTVEQSKLRIWGRICEYWTALGVGMPGKLMEKKIKLDKKWWQNFTGSTEVPEVPGIELIAAEKSQTNQAIQKLIGIKSASYGGRQGKLILIADELPDLSPSILTASMSNLISNKDFQLIALGNYKSDLDAFGQFSRPKNGWDSVTVDDKKWETERGVCVHFDALKSPNWILREDKYPIISCKTIQDAIDNLGQSNPQFWRMFRSFPCPIAEENKIFSEVDFRRYSFSMEPKMTGHIHTLAGLDPSWTTGGDRCVLAISKFGDLAGLPILYWDSYHIFKENSETGVPRSQQIAYWVRDMLSKHGVTQRYLAVDATGAIPFCDSLEDIVGKGISRVFFYGSASEMPVSFYQNKPAKDYYHNRVAEIWHVGQTFMQSEQLKINPKIFDDVARELSIREILSQKSGRKLQIQSKRDIKMLGFNSTDIADAFFLTLNLARERFRFISGGIAISREVGRSQRKLKLKEYSSIYDRKKAYGARLAVI